MQLQAWTINSWLTSPKRIQNLAKKVLTNLRVAGRKGYIEIGTSAYSHPILPMLSDDLIRAQIILDREVVEKYLGKPTWFWPPEGAVDKRTLKIIHQIAPNLIILIPDKCLGKYNFNGPIKIKFKNGLQKVIVFNCLFKDLFMNAEDYRKRPKYMRRPKHLPKELTWSRVRRTVHSPKRFLEILEYLKKDSFVLMRDWENAGSKKGIRRLDKQAKDIGVFLKFRDKINFRLPNQFNWRKAEIMPISKILPASWDMDSTPADPFPWWQPSKYGKIWQHRKPFRRKRMLEWQKLIQEFDRIFQEEIKKRGGLKKALKDRHFKRLLKKTLPALHSCVGWHYFAKRSWKPDYRYSRQALENIVLPALERLTNL
jgi:peptidoglycan/xylan/chitin deacetylase (PgdA/CDA1 family)